jgi:hypothetical protein
MNHLITFIIINYKELHVIWVNEKMFLFRNNINSIIYIVIATYKFTIKILFESTEIHCLMNIIK